MNDIITWMQKHTTSLFDGVAEVTVDREEITVIGALPAIGDGPSDERVTAYRESTREERIGVAREAEELFRRKVSWGVRTDSGTAMFTHLAVPVMTRLRQSERRVLDTLVAGGVARSRADALAWCVRLVGEHEADWITRLREALQAVEQARATGPSAS